MKLLRSYIVAAALGSLFLASGCEVRSPIAYGAANRIIVAMTDELWEELQEDVEQALEPRIFTVRDERTFEVTQVSPMLPEWSKLRQFKQLLVVGTADDEWVARVLEAADTIPDQLPAMVEATTVWARGQIATALVLPPDARAEHVREMLPALHQRLDERFRAHVVERMFVSGRDRAGRDHLREVAGFEILLPEVYRWTQHEDSVWVFRNDWPTPADLTRSILVTWESGAGPLLDAEEALSRRDRFCEEFYPWSQVTERERIDKRSLEGIGAEAVEYQGIWSSPPGAWPAAGPFITRVVICPEQDRTYILDAWLFAPGKDKYEYMIQLEIILDSFRCGDTTPTAS